MIKAFSPATIHKENWQHGEIWHGVDDIAIDIGDMHWYGMGGLVNQLYPLEKIALYPAPYLSSDNGGTGLLTIMGAFWVTSTGFGVLVENDEMTVSFNAPLTGEPHQHSFTTPAPNNERPLPADQIEGDGLLRISGNQLTLRFFHQANAREVVEAYYQLLDLSHIPPESYFRKTMWTTWAHLKNNISHDKIIDLAETINRYDFNCGLMGIDAKWQDEFGSTRFDLDKFPDPQQTIATLHALGMKSTLWCIPFFKPTSQHYQAAIDQGYVLRGQDGEPYIAAWWEGQAAFLDVTKPEALAWHLDNLIQLAESVGLDGYKFDAGEGMFYGNPAIKLDTAPNAANTVYIETLSTRYAWSDVRSSWRNQNAPMLFRQWDKSTRWGFDNGLASCITQAIMLGIIGYRVSFPDMIGGNEYDSAPTEELMIRWTQAVAPMPVIQFSIPPWRFGEDCAAICARYARLHGELADYSIQAVQEAAPVVRPVWWLAPDDETAQTCDDQYLIGSDLLVAPVIMEGARSRDIYLPAGRWASYWDAAEVHAGGQWLRDYPAPLDVLPLFKRI